MGIGHGFQQNLFKTRWQHRFSHGGELRKCRRGRGQRPLSSREPLHLVFKIDRRRLYFRSLRAPKSYSMIHFIFRKYSHRFRVGIEQISIQGDHLHLLIRASRRSQFQSFFRVTAGQIAQIFEGQGWICNRVTDTPRSGSGSRSGVVRGTGLWKHRPFSRVVRGFRAYQTVRNYIQLNEQEALGRIPYQKNRLRGLSERDWAILWSG